MRVLFLCHRIPYPPDKGDKIRAFHQLRALSLRHEVDVFTLADDGADLAYQPVLAKYCRSLRVARIHPRLARLKALPWFLTRTALTVPYFHSAELQKEVRKALLRRSYDRIFIYSSAMAQYLDRDNTGTVITDLVDVDSDKWMQYAGYRKFPLSAIYRREGLALREYEKKVCRKSEAVVVTTEREARLAREIWGATRVHVIPNGVDSAYFSPAAARERAGSADSRPPTVTFTGDMSYFPNEEAAIFFAKKTWPSIRLAAPSARFLIVGRNPSPKVRELQKIAGIEVTGWVPDVRPYLAQTWVSVAPFSIATGIQNKILEAMACGLPVVATPRAVQGLPASVAEAVETADSADELASKVVESLRDLQLGRSKGLEGRRRVMAECNWDRSLGMLLELVEHPASLELSSEFPLPRCRSRLEHYADPDHARGRSPGQGRAGKRPGQPHQRFGSRSF